VLKPQRLLLPFLLALTPTLVVACGKSDPPAAETTPTEAVGEPSPDGSPSTPATANKYTVATAKKQGAIQVYSAPDDSKKAAQTLPSPRTTDTDPPAKVDLVMLVKDQQPGWLEVLMPVRPNGSTGWVKADDFETKTHDYHIEATLGAFRIKAFKGDKQIFEAPIDVAMDDAPTPGGEYYTTELLETPEPNGAYGPYALGLSGFSDVYKTFGKGQTGQLGIHGTNEPQKIGTKVSHGCIRLKNDDITKLVKLDMPLGTPVIINA